MLVGITAAIGCLVALFQVYAAEAPEKNFSHGMLIRIEGMIDSMMEEYLNRKLALAEADGADLLILEIDSPGGNLNETLNIAGGLRDLNFAHTVAYIPKQALSGAAIIALGCDDILMDPKALIGDAGPIFQDEASLFKYAPEKIRSHLAQQVRGLAAAKGRPKALAEAMVDKDLEVYQVKNKQTGEKTYLSQREIDAEANPDQWERIAPVLESGKERFLELTGERAVELELAQGIAISREDLQRHYRLRSELTILEPGGIDTFVYILYNPLVIAILIIIGLIGLYIEFMTPGIGIGGLIAGLCFVLFFWSHFLGGTANWLDVMLFAAGLLCLVAELFIIPGFGVVGVTGLVLILVSLIMACQNFLIPKTNRELTQLINTLLVLLGSGGGFFLAVFFISKKFGSLPFLGKMVLRPPDPVYGFRDDLASAACTAASILEIRPAVNVGDVGIAQSSLRPAGKVRFGSQIVEVVTDGDFIPQGRRVQVIDQSGGKLIVREVGQ